MLHKKSVIRKPVPFIDAIQLLSGLSADEASLVIRMGGAYLNKRRFKQVRAEVKAGQLIEVYIRPPIRWLELSFDDHWIVLDKKKFMICDKPSGVATQGSRDADYNCFYELLKQNCKGYVGLHHRLDQDTSGMMVFSRSKDVNSAFSKLFSEHRIEKKYLCITAHAWPHAGERIQVDLPLRAERLEGQPTKQIHAADGKSAVTRLRHIATSGSHSLVEAMPVTGRTHQIRVHLANSGMPILGDNLYGSRCNHKMMLHCGQLTWPAFQGLESYCGRVAAPIWWQPLLPQDLAYEVELWGKQ